MFLFPLPFPLLSPLQTLILVQLFKVLSVVLFPSSLLYFLPHYYCHLLSFVSVVIFFPLSLFICIIFISTLFSSSPLLHYCLLSFIFLSPSYLVFSPVFLSSLPFPLLSTLILVPSHQSANATTLLGLPHPLFLCFRPPCSRSLPGLSRLSPPPLRQLSFILLTSSLPAFSYSSSSSF